MTRAHRFISTLAIATMVAAGILVASPSVSTATAASGSDFDPGYIISDAQFFDYGSMNAADIQAFIRSKQTNCVSTGSVTCLKDYVANTSNISQLILPAPSEHCTTYTGKSAQTAAMIIYDVAQACKINPQVLLVLLQKEQGLITSAKGSSTYAKATGYACPDTAPCDSTYAGFTYQVYAAAWQFRQYTLYPARAYKIGTVNVPFSPNGSCGVAPVNIRNQATANLYNYTPYQPSAAALAYALNPGGPIPSSAPPACASYGNINFSVYYNSWFGSPTGPLQAGNLDSVTAVPGGFRLTGWWVDLHTFNQSPFVWVNVNGSGAAHIANLPVPWLPALFPGTDANHGFDITIPASPGSYQVCAIGTRNSLPLGCSNVSVRGGQSGSFDAATGTRGAINLSGWAVDFTTAAPAFVWVNVNGSGVPYVANTNRPWFEAAFGGYGDNHGYDISIPRPPGTYNVCVLNINGSSQGCKNVTVPSNAAGSFDTVTAVPGGINLTGWSVDLSTTNPSYIWVNVNGSGGPYVADQSLPWFEALYPGAGTNHGYNVTIPKAPGTYNVCVYGTNSQPLGCKNVTVR